MTNKNEQIVEDLQEIVRKAQRYENMNVSTLDMYRFMIREVNVIIAKYYTHPEYPSITDMGYSKWSEESRDAGESKSYKEMREDK